MILIHNMAMWPLKYIVVMWTCICLDPPSPQSVQISPVRIHCHLLKREIRFKTMPAEETDYLIGTNVKDTVIIFAINLFKSIAVLFQGWPESFLSLFRFAQIKKIYASYLYSCDKGMHLNYEKVLSWVRQHGSTYCYQCGWRRQFPKNWTIAISIVH